MSVGQYPSAHDVLALAHCFRVQGECECEG